MTTTGVMPLDIASCHTLWQSCDRNSSSLGVTWPLHFQSFTSSLAYFIIILFHTTMLFITSHICGGDLTSYACFFKRLLPAMSAWCGRLMISRVRSVHRIRVRQTQIAHVNKIIVTISLSRVRCVLDVLEFYDVNINGTGRADVCSLVSLVVHFRWNITLAPTVVQNHTYPFYIFVMSAMFK